MKEAQTAKLVLSYRNLRQWGEIICKKMEEEGRTQK
jgi:hypothetical protein